MSNARFGRLRDQAIAVLGARLSDHDGAAVLLHEMEVLQTELELQQEELVDSQQRASRLAAYYRQLFFDSPIAMVLLDEGHTMQECNQRAIELLGLGSTANHGFAFERFVTPDAHATWSALAKSPPTEIASAELQIRQFGGERRLCAVTLRRHGEGLLLSLDDVTALRAAQEQRRFADERLARVLRDSRDGVIFIDSVSGLVAEVNGAFAALLGAATPELLGQPLERLFDEADAVRQQLAYRQALARPQQPEVLPLRFKTATGGVLSTEAAVGRITEGQRVYVTLLVRDVTARLRLEAEREELLRTRNQSQKMEALGQLAAGIAHDVNNVLTAILACASLPADATPQETSEALDDIRLAALRGRDVTGRLGTLSRPRPLRPSRFDLFAVLRELHGLLKHSLPRSIELRCELPAGSCYLEGDAGEWHQAFLNLAINARDAMPRGGSLRFWARAESVGVLVGVEDSGSGMSTEVLAHAFEPFFTTKPLGAGTGLGLSHVHAVARAHQVTPRCSSVEGQGTTFTFHFTDAVLQAAAPTPPRGPATRYSGRALVVDDDAAVRKATSRVLALLGIETREADSGMRALELLEQEAAGLSVIVTDLSMPGLDGAQLAQLAHQRWPGIPVVVVTGDLTESRREALERAQVVGVLTKPYSTEELAGLLGPHLRRADAAG